MRAKERPHHAGGVDAVRGAADSPFGERAAAGPGVASGFDRVENDCGVVRTVRVFAADDIDRNPRIDWSRSAAVSSRPFRGPGGDGGKWSRHYPRHSSPVRNLTIVGA